MKFDFVKGLAATGALVLSLGMTGASAQDVAKGEKVFRKCKACHEVGADASNKTGPHLNGIIGRAAGALEGFKYSKAMMEAAEGGLVWDEASLNEFLTKPKAYMKGTKMSFAGIRKDNQRADLIAYLAGFE